MSKNTILALGTGIIIGAAGMWFMNNSEQKTFEVDEIVEGYSTPMTIDNSDTTTGDMSGATDMDNSATDMGNSATDMSTPDTSAATSAIDNATQDAQAAGQDATQAAQDAMQPAN